ATCGKLLKKLGFWAEHGRKTRGQFFLLPPLSLFYSHFKKRWKTFSTETRVIARNTCLNLN
ncbi:MAG: hypothetical protein O4803_08670, partial [Trichodesmium sp. St15_bin1_1]|nr:hypothetical protein [Trichodesmium sp. St16_bin2-tuft]MDE5114321.1 hypothetical protein [Trichodesmium sp. St15_bin1_1]MDE5118623.1 hypothetical protein [Trichodesmium sp. St2_bin2_1]